MTDAEARREEHIRRIVDAAPPLTEAQRLELRRILRPVQAGQTTLGPPPWPDAKARE